MEHKERIEFNDSTITAMIKLAGHSPGAGRALAECMMNDAAIDPDSAWGNMTTMIGLDSYGIYESAIWILYKDVCGQSPLNVSTLLRATQLGLLSRVKLFQYIADEKPVDIAPWLAKVQEELPRFGRV